LKKKTHACAEPDTVSIASVYRVLQGIKKEIPNFDQKFGKKKIWIRKFQ
jgi:hypothetical protein